jgi:putative flippase GtrA
VIRSFFTRQFAQFVFVGVLAALLNWLSRLLFSQWIPFAWAVVIAYVVGMAAAFTLNSFLVFPLSDRPKYAQARDFVLINCAFFPLVWIVAYQLNIWLLAAGMTEHSQELAHAIALATPMLATFLLYKFMAFKERPLMNKPVEHSD